MAFEIEKSWVAKAELPAVVIWANYSHRCGYVELTKDSIFYGMTNEYEVHVILQNLLMIWVFTVVLPFLIYPTG